MRKTDQRLKQRLKSLHDKYKRKKKIPVIVIKEQSRNELCNCGSGKKYKKCCGK